MAKAVTQKAPRQLPDNTGGICLVDSRSSVPPLHTSGAIPSLSSSDPLLSPSAFKKYGGDHLFLLIVSWQQYSASGKPLSEDSLC